MRYDPNQHVGGLPRLPETFYGGPAFVHWSMTLNHRAVGWLDALHHAKLRELLCHVLARAELLCPAYCLTPDHAHFLWVGFNPRGDQKRGAALFREAWNVELARTGRRLQKQAFDHVLREKERERGAFGAVAHYIFQNPVRAGLVREWEAYPFSGAMAPGYPALNPRDEDFWERFWRIYAKCAGAG